MIPEQRLASIVRIVNEKQYCSLQQLVNETGASVSTVRRDLRTLADQQLLVLTRGGAMQCPTGVEHEPEYSVKSKLNHEEKMRIGQAAAAMIQPGETVILDTGTTVYQMVPSLIQMSGITVVTNDVRIACDLSTHDGIDICMIGGQVRKGHYTTTGLWAQQALESLYVEHAFLACDAISSVAGCSITNAEEVMPKQCMIRAGKKRILLADHTKFEKVAFMRLCTLDQIHTVITGKELDPAIMRLYQSIGISILCV